MYIHSKILLTSSGFIYIVSTRYNLKIYHLYYELCTPEPSDPARMESLDRLSEVQGITEAIGGEGYLDEREMAIPDSTSCFDVLEEGLLGQGLQLILAFPFG